ncbi:polysaccharide pyruvyl transferase family protein [Rossellomorea vietnamensis]|uniref:polysaccharide pyruvyl transferase family protein n=1 Tax=Rossellomorea vietnamensis TaxID=218284 RepID=UPI003CF069FD
MKIAIVGNYGNNNNGDEAILCGITEQLTKLGVNKEDVTVFSNNPQNTKDRMNLTSVPLIVKRKNKIKSILLTIIHHYKIMRDFDVVIIGGGGLLMDLYLRDLPIYYTIGLFGKLRKNKILIYGVGVGPLSTKLGKFLVKNLTDIASTISVRDENSKLLLKHIGVKKEVAVIGDPAFSNKVPSTKEKKDLMKVGVTAVPYFSKDYWPVHDEVKYNSFVNSFAANLDKLIQDSNAELIFFSTKYPEDVKVTEDIYKQLVNKERASINVNNMKPNELIELTADLDLVIGTRLHSLIISILTKTPVIGIEYHNKVKDFMEEVNLPEYSLSIEVLSRNNNSIERLYTELNKDINWTNNKIESISNQFVLKETQGLEQIKQYIR